MRAIVLATFGSVSKYNKYLKLKDYISSIYKDCDVFVALSSQNIQKKLQQIGICAKNLDEVIKDIETKGYEKITIVSINLFTNTKNKEYTNTLIEYKDSIFANTKDLEDFILYISKKVSKDDVLNLYILHGSKTNNLDTYINTIENIDKNSIVSTIEGENNFFEIKDDIVNEILELKYNEVQIIPLLLVSGNHYYKDIKNIKYYLNEKIPTNIISISDDEESNLIDLEKIKEIIVSKIG